MIDVAILFILAISLLFISYLTAISSRDLIRLLISLELMFGSVFLALLPLFSTIGEVAFGIAVIIIFTSCSELLILIASITLLDIKTRSVATDIISEGGEP